MKSEELVKQLELYSNAIIGFIVIQGLGFCYQFGSNDRFNKIVKNSLPLALGLAVLFLIVTIAGSVANHYLGKSIISISSENQPIIKALYKSKTIIIIILGLIPFWITIFFGVFKI